MAKSARRQGYLADVLTRGAKRVFLTSRKPAQPFFPYHRIPQIHHTRPYEGHPPEIINDLYAQDQVSDTLRLGAPRAKNALRDKDNASRDIVGEISSACAAATTALDDQIPVLAQRS